MTEEQKKVYWERERLSIKEKVLNALREADFGQVEVCNSAETDFRIEIKASEIHDLEAVQKVLSGMKPYHWKIHRTEIVTTYKSEEFIVRMWI
jgi:hypothetical protein